MSWRAQIRSASFRGVPFGVTSGDKEGGRRTVVHEYPQREDAYVEDMGGAVNRFTLQAFVLGADYMARRDALERALEQPGPGTLVHPWYGEITVSQFAPYKVRHSAQEGGMAVFTLSFARDAQSGAPAAAVNAQISALDIIAGAGNLSCLSFDQALQIAGQTAFVVEQAYEAVVAAVQRVQRILDGNVGEIAGLLGAVTGYDFLPLASLGQHLWSAFQRVGASSGKSAASMSAAWSRAASIATATPLAHNPGSSRARVAANDAAVNAFTRHIAIVEAARNMVLAVPESRAQAQDLREGFMDALDSVLADEGGASGIDGLAAAPLPDALYAALVRTRSATLAALAEAARSAPDVIIFTPSAVLPSLVIAYRLSGSLALEADLLDRNGVIHPGFVPVEPLEVLTYA